MNALDGLILVAFVLSFGRGVRSGMVRQVCSAAGSIGGVLLGAYFSTRFIHNASADSTRASVSLCVIVAVGGIGLAAGEYVGIVLKEWLEEYRINAIDRVLGAVVGGSALLVGAWLGASLLTNVPSPTLQRQIRGSSIVAELNSELPAAPTVIAKLGRAIEPNGFPQVFTGLEPSPAADTQLPSVGAITPAVQKDMASVVKIEGRGCGGIVEGSGFVTGNELVTTNAHVVAGVSDLTVVDQTGKHRAIVVSFDSDLDLAVLRITGLTDAPLTLASSDVPIGTTGAVLGYPGGGPFSASPAAVNDSFAATGRNIYGEGTTTRQVYSLAATVVPGNSGGPLINKDGTVIGVVFAKSSTYNNVGYALTMSKVFQEISQASTRTTALSTGSCAE